MYSRSNMFANLENEFEFASKYEVEQKAKESVVLLIRALKDLGVNDKVIFGTLIQAISLGTLGDGRISDEEEELIVGAFSPFYNGTRAELMELFGEEIDESIYENARLIDKLGPNVALPFLRVVLGFAYIDGVFEDDVAKKLDGIFGMSLLAAFFASGAEEVPKPKIRLTGLEAEIVQWFREDDTLHSLDDIQSHFYGCSKVEVKRALDSLCDKGVLYGGENMMGLYGLDGE